MARRPVLLRANIPEILYVMDGLQTMGTLNRVVHGLAYLGMLYVGVLRSRHGSLFRYNRG